MVDGELTLVAPSSKYVEDAVYGEAVAATYPPDPMSPPGSAAPMPFDAMGARRRIEDFLEACSRGRQRGDRLAGKVPAYHFWMMIDPAHLGVRAAGGDGLVGPSRIAGGIGLRVGQNRELEFFSGHIGYHVFPQCRGRHLAARACRLLLPLCRAHKLTPLWITTNPDNTPSRKTCLRLGARLVDTVAIPEDHPFFARGETHKCRYRLDL